MNVSPDQLARFKDLVYDRSNLSFPVSREPQLQQGLMQRAAACSHSTVDEYYAMLSHDNREFDRLLSLITTRETYFFRMPGHFDALGDIVIPEIVEREGRVALQSLSRGEFHRQNLRAWSAGCATGQEAYSLSMQILDALHYPRAWDVSVLGSDINASAIEAARTGRFERTRLGAMPSRFAERFFEPLSPGEVTVSDEVRTITEFQVMNLRNLSGQTEFRNRFDIIFCRNVLIYFDLLAQQRLITALSDCLKPGGYLFTGEGEVLHLYHHDLEVIEQGGLVFYRKPEDHANEQ